MAPGDFSTGGLYSQQELEDWRQLLSFPAYKATLLSSISYGSCVQTGSYEEEGVDCLTPYDISKLVEDLPQLWICRVPSVKPSISGEMALKSCAY